jgi:DNA-binding transcriptional regulator YiaG
VTPNAETYDPRPEYMAELIESTGLTQEVLGQILGVEARTIRHWIAGTRQFPYLAQFAMECLVLQV